MEVMERLNMEYEELYKKYLRLLKENEYLKSENEKIQKMLLTYDKPRIISLSEETKSICQYLGVAKMNCLSFLRIARLLLRIKEITGKI